MCLVRRRSWKKQRKLLRKKMAGSSVKVVDSDKEKKNKNVSISKRSGVSEDSSDNRCSKKLKSVVENDDDFDSECDEAPIVLPKKLKKLKCKKSHGFITNTTIYYLLLSSSHDVAMFLQCPN
ncbi:hypothetical protein CsatA_008662 [Cannabis sativa]